MQLMLQADTQRLADLTDFARIELDSADVEPWAMMMAHLRESGQLSNEETAWLVKLYNAYDSLDSAWSVFRRWPSPDHWATAFDRDDAADYPCMQERRNLRGGRVLHHLDDYREHLSGMTQMAWLGQVVAGDSPQKDFARMTAWVRVVWGVGRQTAFEWAEFAAKSLGLPLTAGDAQLWESSGPRRCLQRLYNNPEPDQQWLTEAAQACMTHLTEQGVLLAWEDFETIICDFNVMRDGRYYPGRHLAALKEEILACPPDDRGLLLNAFDAICPHGWADIEPGINREYAAVYRDTGVILNTPFGTRE